MKKKNLAFLKSLTQSIAPAGQEKHVQHLFIDYVKPYSDDIIKTRLGSVIAVKKGTSDMKILLSGHADEISLMVNYIDSDGFIYFKEMGGFDAVLLPGMRVNIYHENEVVKGIVGRVPLHLLQNDNGAVKSKDLWIDIGSSSKEETLKKVDLGDVIVWTGEFFALNDDLYVSKAFDNRVGVYTCARVIEELSKTTTYASIYSASNVQEEVGARGAKTSAFEIEPDICIAIDVTFAIDHPNTSTKDSADISLGKGPAITMGSRIHPKLFKRIKTLAEKNKIPYQLEIWPKNTGTDLDEIHAEAKGSAGVLISIPCRYMHSPNEMISYADLENTVKLITTLIKSIDSDECIDMF